MLAVTKATCDLLIAIREARVREDVVGGRYSNSHAAQHHDVDTVTNLGRKLVQEMTTGAVTLVLRPSRCGCLLRSFPL